MLTDIAKSDLRQSVWKLCKCDFSLGLRTVNRTAIFGTGPAVKLG